MSIFDKARELGDLINSSEQALSLQQAKTNFEANPEACKIMEEYSDLQNAIQMQMQTTTFDPKDFEDSRNKLSELASNVRANPIIKAYIDAENEFNIFVNQILTILKASIFGDDSCASGCEGCSGCGQH